MWYPIKNILSFFKRLFSKVKFEDKVLPDIVNSPEAYSVMLVADQQEMLEAEKAIKDFQKSKRRSVPQTYVIPVVFHVIHKGEPIGTGSNISDAQILSTVRVMNMSFSKEMNTREDTTGVSIPIQWMLANQDENGNPLNPINRVNGAALSPLYAQYGLKAQEIGENEAVVKNWSRINNQHVHNIWIVWSIDGNSGGSGIQGASYFPTTSMVDGIYQLYNASGRKHPDAPTGSGPYSFTLKSYTNLGLTAPHEGGHSLAIRHTFDNFSCLKLMPELHFTNIMSYSSQQNKSTWEACQRERAIAVMNASRANLANSTALDGLTSLVADCSIEIVSPKIVQCPQMEGYLTVKITNISPEIIHKMTFEWTCGNDTGTYEWYGPIMPQSIVGNETISIAKVSIPESTVVQVVVTSINDNPTSITTQKPITVPTRNPYKVESSRDTIAGQITWNISGANSGHIFYQNPPQKNFHPGVIETVNCCLPDGDYVFTLTDIAPGYDHPNAYHKLIDDTGNVLLHLTNTNEGTYHHSFTVGKPNKVGDINKDGFVNLLDVSILSNHFNSVEGDSRYNADADLNGDGRINLQDLSILMKNYNAETDDGNKRSD